MTNDNNSDETNLADHLVPQGEPRADAPKMVRTDAEILERVRAKYPHLLNADHPRNGGGGRS